MTITSNIAAKLSVAFVAVAMAVAFVAPSAKAADTSTMSLEELIALVNQLQAQLAGSSSSSSCSYTFTRSLSTGSTGSDVMNLQKFLNMSADTQVAASGTGSTGMETSYFGPMTAAAVSKFQTKYSSEILVPAGLVNPTGYFGPSTMAKANSLCSAMTGDNGSTGSTGSTSGLEGGAGSIDTYDIVAGLSNEEVGEGEEDVEVAGLEIENSEDSDIEIRAVKVVFAQGTADSKFVKYADEVSVWVDGEEFARVDASDFTSSNSYTKTLSLDSGAIIKADATGEIVVAVSGISNLDSGDAGETWTVDFSSIRFEDAQGTTISEDPSTSAVTFSFESYATAADIEFKVSKGDADINDARSIAVSSTTETNNVEILSFEIEVDGSSDVWVDDLAVDFGTSTGDTLSDLISAAELVVDGDVIGSETITTAYDDDGIVVFDNLDWTIDAGDTVEVIVRVDMNELNTGTFGAGATLSASVDPDNSSWTVEDENGDDVSAADKTGTATSDAHTFYGDGIQVDLTDTSVVVTKGDNDDDDYVTLTIDFDVTSYGETIYVDKSIDQTGSSTAGTSYGVNDSSDTSTYFATASSSSAISSTADEGTYGFEVLEGDTKSFTLTVTVANAATSTLDSTYVRAVLTGIGFNTADSATGASTYTSSLASDFKTTYGQIVN